MSIFEPAARRESAPAIVGFFAGKWSFNVKNPEPRDSAPFAADLWIGVAVAGRQPAVQFFKQLLRMGSRQLAELREGFVRQIVVEHLALKFGRRVARLEIVADGIDQVGRVNAMDSSALGT
jgi:hypothetical protein